MMAPLFPIWRQPLLQLRGNSTRGVSFVLLAMFALGLFTLNLHGPHRGVAFALCTGMPMGMLLLMWWIYLLGNVAIQCHPAALQLVPDLRARINRAVLGAWLVIVGLVTALVGVPTGYPGQVAIVTGLVLIEVGIMANLWRFAGLGFALWLMCFASGPFTAWLLAFIHTPAALAAGAAILVLDGWAALRRLARLRGTGPIKSVPINMRSARGFDPQPLFLRPLGTSWFGWHVRIIVTEALLCVLLRLWCAWDGADAHTILSGAREVVAVTMFFTLATAASNEARRFALSRTEQALLCLTPGAPDGAALNRALADMFLSGFVRSALLLAGTSLVALAVLGAQANELARFALAWTVALVLAALPLRDYARARAAPHWPPVLLTALMAVVFSAANNGGGALRDWLAGSVAVGLVSIALVAWRRRRMLAAAPALPAGRIL